MEKGFYEKIRQITRLIDVSKVNLLDLEKISKNNVKNGDVVIFDYSFGADAFTLGFILDSRGFLELRSSSSGWRCDFNDKIPLYKLNFSLETLL